MEKGKRGIRKPNVMPVHLGKLLAEKIKEKRVTHAAIQRKINRANSAIAKLLQRPSMQCYLLWELSVVFKYDFFDLLSQELKKKVGDKLESPSSNWQQRIAELEKEVEELRTNNAYFKKAIDAMAK